MSTGSGACGWLDKDELAECLAASLGRLDVSERVIRIAIDCHPWNGFVEGAFLTATEAATDIPLLDPAEMAAWQHYAFTSSDDEWQRRTAPLRREMRQHNASAADKNEAALVFLRLCARALAHQSVQEALTRLPLHPEFKCSVTHPDTGQEFVDEVAGPSSLGTPSALTTR